jgi:endonuclease YncB( thermonuclease family)
LLWGRLSYAALMTFVPRRNRFRSPSSARNAEIMRAQRRAEPLRFAFDVKTSNVTRIITFVALMLTATITMPTASLAEPMRVLVLGVIDGESFNAIDQEDARHRIRIEAIVAPSRGQPGATESRTHLNELIRGNALRLDPDHGDSAGRLIAQVNCAGSDVGLEQIKAGMARYDPSQAASLDKATREAYASAERAASAAHLGLWSASMRTNRSGSQR